MPTTQAKEDSMLVELTRDDAVMLVELSRADTDGSIAINPSLTAALLASTTDPQKTIVRLADGRGFKVRGSYAELAPLFPDLVEFSRVAPNPDDAQPFQEEGEDDGFEVEPEKIKIAGQYVAAVFGASRPGVTIIRMADGRGFQVQGDYLTIRGQLGVPEPADGYQAPRPDAA
jgi:hypothetical protein